MTFSGENKMILLRSSNTTAIIFGNFFNSNRLWHCGLQVAAIVFGTLVFSRSKTNGFGTSAFSRQQSSLAFWPPAECNRLRHSGIQSRALVFDTSLCSIGGQRNVEANKSSTHSRNGTSYPTLDCKSHAIAAISATRIWRKF